MCWSVFAFVYFAPLPLACGGIVYTQLNAESSRLETRLMGSESVTTGASEWLPSNSDLSDCQITGIRVIVSIPIIATELKKEIRVALNRASRSCS